MAERRTAYAPEYRRQMVELIRVRRTLKHPLLFALEMKGFRRDILLGLSDFGSP